MNETSQTFSRCGNEMENVTEFILCCGIRATPEMLIEQLFQFRYDR